MAKTERRNTSDRFKGITILGASCPVRGKRKMTNEEIKQARELCEKATESEWNIWVDYNDDELFRGAIISGEAEERKDGIVTADWICEVDSETTGHEPEEDAANLKFIAASRTLVPQLLDEVERLRGKLLQLYEAYSTDACPPSTDGSCTNIDTYLCDKCWREFCEVEGE
jgi:hypothetical protein